MVLWGVVVHLRAWKRVDRRGRQWNVCPVGAIHLGGLGVCFGLLLLSTFPTYNSNKLEILIRACTQNGVTWFGNFHAFTLKKTLIYSPHNVCLKLSVLSEGCCNANVKCNCLYFSIYNSSLHNFFQNVLSQHSHKKQSQGCMVKETVYSTSMSQRLKKRNYWTKNLWPPFYHNCHSCNLLEYLCLQL